MLNMQCSELRLLQGYNYMEADCEAHVTEAVSGLRAVSQAKPAFQPKHAALSSCAAAGLHLCGG